MDESKEICTRVELSHDGEPADIKTRVDLDLVTWDNDIDLANPQNWSIKAKWMITMVLSGLAVLPPLSSTMISPAQFAIQEELRIESSVVLQICLSVFNLGIGLGPLIMGPLSENYGRYPVVVTGNVFFLVWNTACGFVNNEAAFIACRIFTGIGSTASLSVMGGTVGDIWPAEKRATAIGMATFFPLLGPAIGPIVGGFVTEYASWRWTLWAVSIADAVMLLLAAIFLHETYAPKILRAKAKTLRQSTNNNLLHSAYDDQVQSLIGKLQQSFSRPFQILSSQTVVQILCVLQAVLYGTMFLNLYSYPLLWTYTYHQSTSTGSLNYISAALGFTLGSQGCASLIGGGLLILGWTGQYKCFWILPNIGNVIFLTGVTGAAQICSTYTIDAFSVYAASAAASQNFVRSVASFAFPLFAPAMYATLGWGWASTLLSLVTFVIGLFTGAILWTYGPRLRQRQIMGGQT